MIKNNTIVVSMHKVGLLFSDAEGFGNVIPEYIFCKVWPVVNNCQWDLLKL